MNISTPEKIKENLHASLGKLGNIEECALLDYPDYLNIGDHLIWLGTIFYLHDVLKTKIKYVATIKNFSETAMERKIGTSPILLQGGGNLGDTWTKHQDFRERIIKKYCDRPIVILPQSIYFTSPAALKETANIFNSHPNLTIFIRDNYSYEIATQAFYKCQVIKAPDMAFKMVNMTGLAGSNQQKSSILYLCRDDLELNQSFSSTTVKLPNLAIEDWVSYKWIYRENLTNSDAWYWRLPGIVRLIREGWQRGLSNPREWVSRQLWQKYHPDSAKFDSLNNPTLHRQSWSLMHSGIYQFQQHRLVITNRLHGHILCLLLEIPHIFLPNSYHKNEAFYQTWTSEIPFCRFVKDPAQIENVAKELLA
jgi:pyruvyl transferase EpsO